MTYQLNPRLFVENGAALAAQRVHRHDAYRLLLAKDPAPARKADNDTAIAECAIRFAL